MIMIVGFLLAKEGIIFLEFRTLFIMSSAGISLLRFILIGDKCPGHIGLSSLFAWEGYPAPAALQSRDGEQ